MIELDDIDNKSINLNFLFKILVTNRNCIEYLIES